jgi:murein DD-endopeptidase MepM/ murein hydrolase activator NlpD
MSWPASGYISSSYGYRLHPVYNTWKFHSGIDIACGYGSAICAAASGTVIYVTEPVEGCNTGGSGYGNYCIIDHGDGVTTLYAHARDIYVSVGDYVSAGQQIGEVGSTGTSTGAHLHFEVRVNGTAYNPCDYLS